jgi:GTPase
MDTYFPQQPPEKEEGNKEYKRYLLWSLDKKKGSEIDFINRRASQMLYRLLEGNGKAIYLIGVDDNGKIYSLNEENLSETIRYIKIISNKIGAMVKVIRIYKNKVCSVRIILDEEILESKMANMRLY